VLVTLEEMDCDPVADTLRDCVTLDEPDNEGVAELEAVNVTLADALELGDEDWLGVPDWVSDGDPVTDGDDDPLRVMDSDGDCVALGVAVTLALDVGDGVADTDGVAEEEALDDTLGVKL